MQLYLYGELIPEINTEGNRQWTHLHCYFVIENEKQSNLHNLLNSQELSVHQSITADKITEYCASKRTSEYNDTRMKKRLIKHILYERFYLGTLGVS